MSDTLSPVPYVPAWEQNAYRLFLMMPAGVGPISFVRVEAGQRAGCALQPYLSIGLPMEDIVLAGQWPTEKEQWAGTSALLKRLPYGDATGPGGSVYGWGQLRGEGTPCTAMLWGIFARRAPSGRWRAEPGTVRINLYGLRPQLAKATKARFFATGLAGVRASTAQARAGAQRVSDALDVGEMGSAREVLSAVAQLALNATMFLPDLLRGGDPFYTAPIHPPLVVASAAALGLRT